MNKNIAILLKTKKNCAAIWIKLMLFKVHIFHYSSKCFPCFINVLLINVFFIQNTFICNKQFGFIPDQNKIKALEELAEKVKWSFENKFLSSAVPSYLTKAHDCMSHEILINNFLPME